MSLLLSNICRKINIIINYLPRGSVRYLDDRKTDRQAGRQAGKQTSCQGLMKMMARWQTDHRTQFAFLYVNHVRSLIQLPDYRESITPYLDQIN